MEIRTPQPETRPVQLRDVDFRFPGETLSVTLRPDDALEQSDSGELTIVCRRTGERTTVYRDKLLWMSERSRIVQEPTNTHRLTQAALSLGAARPQEDRP